MATGGIQQATTDFATKVANDAQQSTKLYQYSDTVNGKRVLIEGIGYKLKVFIINEVDYVPKDMILETRNQFKAYLIESLVNSI
jgi:hypothetical protein